MPSSYQVEFTHIVKAPREHVVATVQDAMKMIKINPLVVGVHQDTTDESKYTIHDIFYLLGCIPMKTKYETRVTVYSEAQDGPVMRFQTTAGAGTTLNNVWTVKHLEDGMCEVKESVEISTSPIFMPFIRSTMGSAHTSLLRSLAETVEGKPLSTPAPSNETPWPLIVALFPVLSACLYYIPIIKYLYICCLCLWLHRRLRDPYDDTFHLVLNTRPGVDSKGQPAAPPETEWLNMGYWKDTDVFPDAAEALALKLIEAGRCRPSGHVLDVGHACGDSLLVHLKHANVPRPQTLTGITSLPSHHLRAKRRVDDFLQGVPSTDKSPSVMLHCTDAICRDPTSRSHPLSPSSLAPPYTSILALDCAYHFRSRRTFLEQSFARLAPGGYIALADITVSNEYLQAPKKYASYLLAHVLVHPTVNLISSAAYAQQLADIGFEDIQVLDITDDVFPGFRAFLRTQSGSWRAFEKVLGLWVNLGRRFVLVSARKP